MDTENIQPAAEAAPDASAVSHPAPPVHNRFLFVDIAALRAKQLRRGAMPRLNDSAESAGKTPDMPHKAERVAMEEVRRGLVHYDVPAAKPVERT
jgi:DNA-directed RNA polymerase subunit K/omega